MAKRFIDTGLFDDDWFMDLSKEAKILWIYFLTKCNHAGMLKLNEKLCRVQTDIRDLNGIVEQLGNRIITVSERLYFIPKFLQYQYPGFPKSQAKAQLSAIEILTKHGLFKEGKLTVTELLPNSYSNNNNNGFIKDSGENKSKKPEKFEKFAPPTLDEVILYFTENGYTDDAGKRAFNFYAIADWHDSRGNKIKNWKQKMNGVWFKDENKPKEEIKRVDGYPL